MQRPGRLGAVRTDGVGRASSPEAAHTSLRLAPASRVPPAPRNVPWSPSTWSLSLSPARWVRS
jgi:hypothetical protein